MNWADANNWNPNGVPVSGNAVWLDNSGTNPLPQINAVSGANARVKLGNRYVRLPYWGKPGHKTLGNFYTTILNAHGNPIKHYGDLDLEMSRLKLEQTGPIKQFLA